MIKFDYLKDKERRQLIIVFSWEYFLEYNKDKMWAR